MRPGVTGGRLPGVVTLRLSVHHAAVALALVAALGACGRRAPPPAAKPRPSGARSLAAFTVDLAAAQPVRRTAVVRAASIPIPVVQDGKLTNPAGTFELWSEYPFTAWPAESGTCHGEVTDRIQAEVFLKAFTAEQLRNVGVVFTRIDGNHPVCVSDAAPAGYTGTSLGVRSYAASAARLQGNAGAPTDGGPEKPVTWSFDWSGPDVRFLVAGEVWGEPVPALSEFGAPFSLSDPATPPSVAAGAALTWSQVPGDFGDPVVDSVVIRICADSECKTVKQTGTVGRGANGEFSYALTSEGLTAGQPYWAALYNQWVPGVPLSTVTGSLTPTPLKLVYTGP